MKITLPQNQIKEFLKLASYVELEEILIEQSPIYEHIKIKVIFGTCILTKTSNVKFVQYSFDTVGIEDCELLVSETDLISFCKSSKRDTILIDDQEKELILSDGYLKPKFGKAGCDIKLFPKTPKIPKESIKITKQIIDLLNVSKNYIGTDKLTPFILYAHIKGDLIYATDAFATIINKIQVPEGIVYLDKENNTKSGFPLISLTAKECDLISSFYNVDFIVDDGWNVFKTKNCIYGCRLKADIVDVSELISGFAQKIDRSKYIKIQRLDFLDFCESTFNFTKKGKEDFKSSKLELIEMSTTTGERSLDILFSYDNPEKKINNHLQFLCKVVGFQKGFTFNFSHTRIKSVLESLPHKEIYISDSSDGLPFGIWIEDNKDFCIVSNKMQI